MRRGSARSSRSSAASRSAPRCKIQSHSFICEGVELEDEVFVGHGVTFVNDKFPRATANTGELQDSGGLDAHAHRSLSSGGGRLWSGHPRGRRDRRGSARRRRCGRHERRSSRLRRGRQPGSRSRARGCGRVGLAMARVDVVIVLYNSAGTIRDCVLPLAATDWISICVVDNASDDGGMNAVADLRVTGLALDQNVGFAAGCNRGWRLGSAPYILFLNPDARVDTESLWRLGRSSPRARPSGSSRRKSSPATARSTSRSGASPDSARPMPRHSSSTVCGHARAGPTGHPRSAGIRAATAGRVGLRRLRARSPACPRGDRRLGRGLLPLRRGPGPLSAALVRGLRGSLRAVGPRCSRGRRVRASKRAPPVSGCQPYSLRAEASRPSSGGGRASRRRPGALTHALLTTRGGGWRRSHLRALHPVLHPGRATSSPSARTTLSQ